MAEHFTEREISYFFEAFRHHDTGMDGFIQPSAVRPALLTLGQTPTDKELNNLIDIVGIDMDGTRCIDFQGFLTILALKLKHPDKEEHLRLAFKIFDKDGNGNVSAAELKEAMTTLGEDFTQDDIDEMIKLADIDGDGQVNYEEFIRVMLSS